APLRDRRPTLVAGRRVERAEPRLYLRLRDRGRAGARRGGRVDARGGRPRRAAPAALGDEVPLIESVIKLLGHRLRQVIRIYLRLLPQGPAGRASAEEGSDDIDLIA